jgi:hypothetical protein
VNVSSLLSLWREQPWSPLFLDWEIEWRATPAAGDRYDADWRLAESDYAPVAAEPPAGGIRLRGRSLLSPIGGSEIATPLGDLRALLAGDAGVAPDVHKHLSRFFPVWDQRLKELQDGALLGQALAGLHQAFLRRDVTLPRVQPDRAAPWHTNAGADTADPRVEPLLAAPRNGMGTQRLAPPTENRDRSFSLQRAGALRIHQLWLVDDFGQTCDLLHGSTAGRSSGQTLNPRVRWGRDSSVVSLPPRIVQPARLNFDFARDGGGPIAGWVFYNQLDGAVSLCDASGALLGELVEVENESDAEVQWESLQRPRPARADVNTIADETLRAFASSLLREDGVQRLRTLISTIDGALTHIRPGTDAQEHAWASRPLALARARIGFELYGDPWSDPAAPVPPVDTAAAAIAKLQLPVRLGCADDPADGLVGTFVGGNDGFSRLVPAPWLGDGRPQNQPTATTSEGLRAAFGSDRPIVLLVDPRGSIQATSGLLPSRTIRLSPDDYEVALGRIEVSFRVGPVLLPAGQPPRMPAPASTQGQWWFAADAGGPERRLDALDPSAPFDGVRVIAVEGRMTLRRDPEATR